MKYREYAIQYYLCILRIELMHEMWVPAPKEGPDWLVKLIDYLLSEYANSRDGLYIIGQEFSLSHSFSDLKAKLINSDVPELEEANEKCHWKETRGIEDRIARGEDKGNILHKRRKS